MTEPNHNYVNGEWVSSETGETFAVHDPAAPNETVASYQQSGAADAAEAVEAATNAQDEWAATPGPERGRTLRQAGTSLADRKDEITELLVEEEGKACPEAADEVQCATDTFHYSAGKASDLGGTVKGSSGRDTTLYTRKEPVGDTFADRRIHQIAVEHEPIGALTVDAEILLVVGVDPRTLREIVFDDLPRIFGRPVAQLLIGRTRTEVDGADVLEVFERRVGERIYRAS